MGNMLADMLLNQMNAGDNAKVNGWVRQNIVVPAIEELLKPDNLQRLAIAIVMEMKAQGN